MAGNPTYTSVSVSNYNASPPANDGSATAANLVNWDHPKEKLGDPLKTAIESINTGVDASFDSIRQMWSQREAKSTGFSVSASADDGKLYDVSGNTAATLPTAANAGNAFRVTIRKTDSSATTLTITPGGSDTINGTSGNRTSTVQYYAVTLVSDGVSDWRIVDEYPQDLRTTANPTFNNFSAWADFTPSMTFGGSSTGVTFSENAGRYCRVKNTVFFAIAITLTSNGSGTGDAVITGLPVAAATGVGGTQNWSITPGYTLSVNLDAAGGYYSVAGVISEGATEIVLQEIGDNVAPASLTEADVIDTSRFRFKGWYEVA